MKIRLRSSPRSAHFSGGNVNRHPRRLLLEGAFLSIQVRLFQAALQLNSTRPSADHYPVLLRSSNFVVMRLYSFTNSSMACGVTWSFISFRFSIH